MVAASLLTDGQGESLKLILKETQADAGKAPALINELEAFLQAGILTQNQFEEYHSAANSILNNVTIS